VPVGQGQGQGQQGKQGHQHFVLKSSHN
jgi:hypothetical protein